MERCLLKARPSVIRYKAQDLMYSLVTIVNKSKCSHSHTKVTYEVADLLVEASVVNHL